MSITKKDHIHFVTCLSADHAVECVSDFPIFLNSHSTGRACTSNQLYKTVKKYIFLVPYPLYNSRKPHRPELCKASHHGYWLG